MIRRLLSRLRKPAACQACPVTACDTHVCAAPQECGLDAAAAGCVTCVRVEGVGPEATRLKRLGICEGQTVEVLRVGEPMIVRAAGTQVGLSRRLAKQVSVQPIS